MRELRFWENAIRKAEESLEIPADEKSGTEKSEVKKSAPPEMDLNPIFEVIGMFGGVLNRVEVVWSKRVVGVHDQVNLNLGVASIGSRKLNNNFYAKAMDKAAQKIVDSLIADSKNIFQ